MRLRNWAVSCGFALSLLSGAALYFGSSTPALAAGGCGPDYHRDGYGYCRPNWREWQQGWRACPPGYHLGREGRRCWPNY